MNKKHTTCVLVAHKFLSNNYVYAWSAMCLNALDDTRDAACCGKCGKCGNYRFAPGVDHNITINNEILHRCFTRRGWERVKVMSFNVHEYCFSRSCVSDSYGSWVTSTFSFISLITPKIIHIYTIQTLNSSMPRIANLNHKLERTPPFSLLYVAVCLLPISISHPGGFL